MENTIYIKTPTAPSLTGNGSFTLDNKSNTVYDEIHINGTLLLGEGFQEALIINNNGTINDTDKVGTVDSYTLISNKIHSTGEIQLDNRTLNVDEIACRGSIELTNVTGRVETLIGGMVDISTPHPFHIETLIANSQVLLTGPITVGTIKTSAGINLSSTDAESLLKVTTAHVGGSVVVSDFAEVDTLQVNQGGVTVTGNGYVRELTIYQGGLTYETSNPKTMDELNLRSAGGSYEGTSNPKVTLFESGSLAFLGGSVASISAEIGKTPVEPTDSPLIDIVGDLTVTQRIDIAGNVKLSSGVTLTTPAGVIGGYAEDSSGDTIANVTVNPNLVLSLDVLAVPNASVPYPELLELKEPEWGTNLIID